MKIEVGKYYKLRDGSKAYLDENREGEYYQYRGYDVKDFEERNAWTKDGAFLDLGKWHDLDIVAELEEEEKIGHVHYYCGSSYENFNKLFSKINELIDTINELRKK